MHRATLLPALFALAAALPAARAQEVGSSLPEEVELEDFGSTEAEAFEDFYGRAILIEFFAHW